MLGSVPCHNPVQLVSWGRVVTVMLGFVPCHNPVQAAAWGRDGNCHVGFCSMPQSGAAGIMGKGW